MPATKIALIFYTMIKNQVEYDETIWAARDPRRRKDWKQNSNGKPNNSATNLSPSNPRLHNELVRTAGVPWSLADCMTYFALC